MKRTLLPISFIVFVILLTGACEKAATDKYREAVVHVNTTLASHENATKGPLFGTEFPDEASYGIFVSKHGSTTLPHKSNSWNLKAQYSSSTGNWSYFYVSNLSTGSVSSGSSQSLILTEREDEEHADLYAYYPYGQDAFHNGPSRIPYVMSYSYGLQYDLMYATENLTSSNADLDPASSNLSATFTFKHAYALLKFNFRLLNDSSTSPYGTNSRFHLQTLYVTLNDPEHDGLTTAKLYSSGTFNALTGSFNDDGVEASSMRVHVGQSVENTVEKTLAHAMLVPTEVADDELVFTFESANGIMLQPFYLKKEYVKHNDGITYGLKGGYVYTFHFTIDNYIYFNGFTVSDSWEDEILGSGEI